MGKLYYSIREVSSIVDEEQHILRYWEKEFKNLTPKKNSAGNRKYSDKDIATIRKIKYYLRDEKLSLKGAKERMDGFVPTPDGFSQEENVAVDSIGSKVVEIPRNNGVSGSSISLNINEAKELRSLIKLALDELK